MPIAGITLNWARFIRLGVVQKIGACPEPVEGCHEQMRVISFIEDQEVIKKILEHLDFWDVKPRPPPRSAKAQPTYTEP